MSLRTSDPDCSVSKGWIQIWPTISKITMHKNESESFNMYNVHVPAERKREREEGRIDYWNIVSNIYTVHEHHQQG